MAIANYKCPKCGKIKTVEFKPGDILQDLICECGEKMKRQFKSVSVGTITSDEMTHIGQMMLYS